jgi:ribosome biogenesis GTPase / thiamine phosphate phosphatase
LTDPLARMGWDDHWSALLRDHTTQTPAMPARVCRGDRDSCDVLCAEGPELRTVTAAWSNRLRREHRLGREPGPVTGDWVLLESQGGQDVVDQALPRRTAIARAKTDGSSDAQVLAANADIAAVTEGLTPDPDPGRIERLLALAWASGAQPVVLLTKADLVDDAADRRAQLAHLAPGAETLVTSAATGAGLEPLRNWLASGRTIALLGASGVGKSTLLNALVGDEVMRTRTLRSDGKGRHTTVTRELHPGPAGGALLDTPGLRTVGLAGAEALDDVFADVEALALRCRFRDCSHRSEPGCAVLAAVETGALQQRRLASYRKLLREAQYQAARTDARLRTELTQVWKQRQRDYRARPFRKT